MSNRVNHSKMMANTPATLSQLRQFAVGQFSAENVEPANIEFLVKVSPVGTAANFICATLSALALLGTTKIGLLIGWYLALILMCAYTLYRYSKIRHKKVTRVSKNGLRRILQGSAIQALPWASYAILFLGSREIENQAVMFAVFAAGTAGGAIMLCRLLPAVTVYTALTLGALTIKALYLIAVGDPVLDSLLFIAIALCSASVILGFSSSESYMAVAFEVNQRQLRAKLAALDQAEADIDELSRFDPVTGLVNRTVFTTEIHQAIARSQVNGETVALLILDLDSFKRVNDTLGYESGDTLLRDASKRLVQLFPEGTMVARLGGDEFAVLYSFPPDSMQPDYAYLATALMRKPFQLGSTDFKTSASVGVAYYPNEASDAAQLYSFAETALTKAKSNGRGKAVRFDANMSDQIQSEETLHEELISALRNDELVLYYQPQVNLKTGTLHGLEALLRWEHPTRGVLGPHFVLEVAEKKALILDVCDRIFEIVARDILWFHAQEFNPHRISVNIHASQVVHSERLLQQIEKLESFGIDPNLVCLEVTEGCILEDHQNSTFDVLQSFRDRGYRLSLDDFGTGYASLASLRTIPTDEIKIDRSFVQNILSDPVELTIVESLMNIASSRNLNVVAEGVETQTHVAILQDLDCPIGQGYYFSKPVDRERVIQEFRSYCAHDIIEDRASPLRSSIS